MAGVAGDLTGHRGGFARETQKKRDAGREFEGAEKTVEAFVHAADALEARDGFLADIAAFVEIDGALFESGFLRKGVFGEFAPPDRHAVKDAEEFDVGEPEFGEVGRKFGGILTGEVEARDNEGGGGEWKVFETRSEFRYGGWQGGEEVVERLWQRDREEFDIVGDDVSLEAGLDIFCKGGGTFDHE
ncbi:MAG: hypothetical protein CAK85_00410 [Spartobacteria bacterium AMD-G5]|nr:MAG: hypothetical protein CAK85_00410 [Spartobacteria bacterium AMD-G5]